MSVPTAHDTTTPDYESLAHAIETVPQLVIHGRTLTSCAGWLDVAIHHLHRRFPAAGWRFDVGHRPDGSRRHRRRSQQWINWWYLRASQLRLTISQEQVAVGAVATLPSFERYSPGIMYLLFDSTQPHQIHVQIVTGPFCGILHTLHPARLSSGGPSTATRIVVVCNSDLDAHIQGYQWFMIRRCGAVILGTGPMLISTCTNPSMFTLRGWRSNEWYWTVLEPKRLLEVEDEYGTPRSSYYSTHRRIYDHDGRSVTLMRLNRWPRHVPELRRIPDDRDPTQRFLRIFSDLRSILPVADLCAIVLSHLWCCWMCYTPNDLTPTPIVARPCGYDHRRRTWVWYRTDDPRYLQWNRAHDDEFTGLDDY